MILDPKNLWIGDVAVFMRSGGKGVLDTILYGCIGFFQRVLRRSPRGRNAIHIMIRIEPPKVDNGWLSAEFPKTVLRECPLIKGERVQFLRLKNREQITPAGWMALHDLAMNRVGTLYDPIDLLNFVTAFFLLPPVPDLGDDNLVCSTTASQILNGVCETSGIAKPFPDYRKVTPADFVNSDAFETVGVVG